MDDCMDAWPMCGASGAGPAGSSWQGSSWQPDHQSPENAVAISMQGEVSGRGLCQLGTRLPNKLPGLGSTLILL